MEALSHAYYGFKWQDAVASKSWHPVAACASYLCTVYFLSQHMDKRSAYSVPSWTLAAHNVVLSVGSAIMFVGCLYEIIQRARRSDSYEWLLCEDASQSPDGPLFFWSYIYYMSKFYELIDTVLVLVQKRKIPNFKLQVYHHAVVIFMAWLWLETRQSLQFVGLLFNTFVHVVMYHYYWMRTQKIQVSKAWKNSITRLQIVQFVTSGIMLFMTLYVHVNRATPCQGLTADSSYSLVLNAVFNLTLLFSFIDVLGRNKKKD